MLDAAVWGTVGQWVSGLATSAAAITAASVYLRDANAKRYEQCLLVFASYTPTHDECKYKISIRNASSHPIFLPTIYVFEGDPALKEAASRALDDATMPPEGYTYASFGKYFKSRSEDITLEPGQTKTEEIVLEYKMVFYDIIYKFQDMRGQTWHKMARGTKFLKGRELEHFKRRIYEVDP